MQAPYFIDDKFQLFAGDCRDFIKHLVNVNMVFADPPYFLSNDGLTISNGKITSVNKGDWDKLIGNIDDFNFSWLSQVYECLAPTGTIWVCGTMHNIYSIAKVLEALHFKILNTITWQKKNPPPNFSCRYFTHSTEFIIWAKKETKKAHYFNYQLMKNLNGNKQMKDVWTFPAIAPWEKINGKHPTQKPLSILARAILASTRKNDIILDPFCGSSTTGIAANLFSRNYIGIDIDANYLEISKKRFEEMQLNSENLIRKISGIDISIVSNFDK